MNLMRECLISTPFYVMPTFHAQTHIHSFVHSILHYDSGLSVLQCYKTSRCWWVFENSHLQQQFGEHLKAGALLVHLTLIIQHLSCSIILLHLSA